MGLNVHAQDSIVPANSVLDFNDIADQAGPFIVGLVIWLAVDDPIAGGLQFQMNHIDPTGGTRASAAVSGVLPLNSAGFYISTPLEPIQRQSGSSLWELVFSLGGLAGSALVSYRVLHYPTASFISW